MTIELESIGKKFRTEWIFRRVNLQFSSGNSYTFVGANGSGKSTLLQVIAGILPQNEGNINYVGKKSIKVEEIYQKIVIAAPYLELIEEFTLQESIKFHQKFKPLRNGLSTENFIDLINLTPHRNKQVKYFSSGMKQRLKLGLAFHSAAEIIMLDEPTSNLDKQGVNWYLSQIKSHTTDRLLIICSNQPHEYDFCPNVMDMQQFK